MSRDGRDGDTGWVGYDKPSEPPAVAQAPHTPDTAGTPMAPDLDPNPQEQRVATTDPAWLRDDTAQGAAASGETASDTASHTASERTSETAAAPAGATGSASPKNRHADEEPVGGLAVLGAALKEFVIVVGMALVLSFVVKTWLLQAFYIPSGSMENTLVLNDRVIVSKLTPRPIDLKRGDIIVFADPGHWLDATTPVKRGPLGTVVSDALTFVGLLPDNSENHLIKRVIGLPGDHVVCCDEGGRITINGTAIKEPYLKPGDAASEQNFDITVPSGKVWVMGDHRSNSADSRAHDAPANDGSQGSVDESLIVGRAVALVWPLDHLTWLSNPTSTFATVPAPAAAGSTRTPAKPSGGPTTGGSGGGEIGGTDAPTGGG